MTVLIGTAVPGEWLYVQAERKAKQALSQQEALIYAMVAAAACDRTISDVEIARMHAMVRELPALRGLEDAWFSQEAQDCGRLLAKPDGMHKVIRLVSEALVGEAREIAYVLAAEVAASDLALKDDERNYLALLADALRLDELVRAALARSAHVRHRAL